MNSLKIQRADGSSRTIGGIRIDLDEWREPRSAIDQMFSRIETNATDAPERP